MVTTDEQKVDKLITRIFELVEKIQAECKLDFNIQLAIDQYYLIQSAVELKLLYEAFQMDRIDQDGIEKHYKQVYFRWREDIRRLNAYRLNLNGKKTRTIDYTQSKSGIPHPIFDGD